MVVFILMLNYLNIELPPKTLHLTTCDMYILKLLYNWIVSCKINYYKVVCDFGAKRDLFLKLKLLIESQDWSDFLNFFCEYLHNH